MRIINRANDMSLQLYRTRRDFRITPEPSGKTGKRKQQGLSFTIQQHAASRLHYDFRLELDGVLLSWAVPKGPSLDPDDKRLAMHIEDHPMEYGEFEGVIPPKQYGAGTVLLWDRGVWIPKEDPRAGYRKGRLKFDLKGEKLHGGWTLVKSRSSNYGGDNAWLLIKEDDEHAVPAKDGLIVQDKPKSVSSGRSLDEVRMAKSRVWESSKSVAENVKAGKQAARKTARRPVVRVSTIKGAVAAPMPRLVKPQLATLVDALPEKGNWLQEIKYDGYRMLCRIENGEARMYSRSGKNWTREFRGIVQAAAGIPAQSAWLDGELVIMDEKGRSSFQALQNALSGQQQSGMMFIVFDLPYLDGHDLSRLPLLKRKQVLEKLLSSPPPAIRYGSHVELAGDQFLNEACKLGLEGVIAKAAESTYFSGRNRNWLKIKCDMRQEMVIGGYTDPQGSRTAFGALLLGVYEADGSLRYSGKVGTGFDEATLGSLHARLKALEQDKPAFANPPKGAEARRSHWVRPELVGEISFTEWTREGTLRHPVFQGLRQDKKASEVVRERPLHETREESNSAAASSGASSTTAPARSGRRKASSKGGHTGPGGIKLTNPDKLLYPDAGISKQDLIDFYSATGDWILPHLKNRPLSLVRCPNGWQQGCFFQKKADASVDAVLKRVEVNTSDGPEIYMMANSLPAVFALVQMGVLEIHPWGSAFPKLDKPDRIIFDLDPDDAVPWGTLVEAVQLVKTLLEELGLESFVKTTGGKGLHCVVPIRPKHSWHTIKAFSKAAAELLVRTFPDRFTSKISKSSRIGKIFIDYLRNGEGATAISAYSIRARAGAPVAVPLAWNELKTDMRFDYFNVRSLARRLKQKKDPWREFFSINQSLSAAALKRLGVEPA